MFVKFLMLSADLKLKSLKSRFLTPDRAIFEPKKWLVKAILEKLSYLFVQILKKFEPIFRLYRALKKTKIQILPYWLPGSDSNRRPIG